MADTVSFEATNEERDAALRIAQRAADVVKATTGRKIDILSTHMDLLATHANGCPLDFARLEAADDLNLMHDLGGIHRHLDRRTGQLGGCFLPRFAARAQNPQPGDSPAMVKNIDARRAGRKPR